MLDDMTAMPELPAMDRPITAEPRTSFTLPSGYYTDPAVYEREKEAVFYRTWQYVAHRSAFAEPGDYVTLPICDQNILVIKGGDGVLRAFYNVCRHRGHELLSEPRGNVASAIVCPYHAWTFEREGGLRAARFSSKRPGFDKADFGLRPIRLELFCDCVFVNLDDDAQSLADLAGEMETDLRRRVPWLGDLRMHPHPIHILGDARQHAGWKVVVDNYVECYHCRHAHPDFASIISMDDYQVDVGPIWSRQLGPQTRPVNSAYEFDPDEGYPGAMFWYLWPNTTFNLFPGSNELAVYRIRPIDHEWTSFEGDVLTTDGRTHEARTTYTANVLAPEDIALCESVQRGLKSKGYDQGPIMAGDVPTGENEYAIHHFHRLVHEALTGHASTRIESR
ncbi:MAG: Rieske 2Fe-2S domain-containing protein [Thiotrichales bacterium]|nr:Rieske 2Fe-2S domain-containing protein [Thiotrichales bacterium]